MLISWIELQDDIPDGVSQNSYILATMYMMVTMMMMVMMMTMMFHLAEHVDKDGGDEDPSPEA